MRQAIVLSAVLAGLTTTLPGQQASGVPSTLTKGDLYDHYLSGSPANVTPRTGGGVLLAGGGTDQPDAFRWFITKAGGGDMVVLRASGADGYHPFVMRLGGVDSIESFVVKSRGAATDPFLLRQLANAEAIFFAGGDQSRYVAYFKDTPVQTAINEAARRGVPIGGTSAGLAILGEFSYAALEGSATTAEATANPFHENVTLERGFLDLPHLGGLITDSHVIERGRLGRTVAFMARLTRDGWLSGRPARAIAIDRATAVLVEPDGRASVVGPNTAYFLQAGAPPVCEPGRPLTSGPVSVFTVTSASTFNLVTWTGANGVAGTMSVTNGQVSGPASPSTARRPLERRRANSTSGPVRK